MHHFTLHKTLYHAAMLWMEHLIKNHFFEQWTFFAMSNTASMLRYEVSLQWPSPSLCYGLTLLCHLHALYATVLTCFNLLCNLHALDATFWTFFAISNTLLMLRYELSVRCPARSWCYVMNFLCNVRHALDAPLRTFCAMYQLVWRQIFGPVNAFDFLHALKRFLKNWSKGVGFSISKKGSEHLPGFLLKLARNTTAVCQAWT